MSAEALVRVGDFSPQLAEMRRLSLRPGPQYGGFPHALDRGVRRRVQRRELGGARIGRSGLELPSSSRPASRGRPELKFPGIYWVPARCHPPRQVAETARLKSFLGEVHDKMDTTYVNGRWVGASSWVENPRVYEIPAGALRPGRNVIAVRVFKAKAAGGFLSSGETLRLQLADGSSLPLAGTWQTAMGFEARPPQALPLDLENYPTMPAALYNGMIAPVAPLALAGCIWYQGEANTTRAAQYRKLLPALIADSGAIISRQSRSSLLYRQPSPPFTAHRARTGHRRLGRTARRPRPRRRRPCPAPAWPSPSTRAMRPISIPTRSRSSANASPSARWPVTTTSTWSTRGRPCNQ